MIVRYIEICPHCGQHEPWRKRSTQTVHGQKRVYVACKRCGFHETIVYRLRQNDDILPKR